MRGAGVMFCSTDKFSQTPCIVLIHRCTHIVQFGVAVELDSIIRLLSIHITRYKRTSSVHV